METKVLVTGGAGFIGSHTVEALLTRGLQVKVLDNFSTGKRANLASASHNLEVIQGDIRDADAVSKALRDVTHCLHLAAQVSVVDSIEDPRHSADLNILGFITVLDAARKAGIKRLVFASSAAVYGNPATLPLVETSEPAPLSPYGLEKYINERYAQLYRALHDMSILGLRYFNVYGPRQDPSSPYAGVITRYCDQLKSAEALKVYGDGQQTRDFIYVTDVAEANAAALFADAQETINVASGTPVSLLDLIDELGQLLSVEPRPEFQSERPGDIRHSSASLQRMRASIDFIPETTLRQGLRRLLAGAADQSNARVQRVR